MKKKNKRILYSIVAILFLINAFKYKPVCNIFEYKINLPNINIDYRSKANKKKNKNRYY